MLRFLETKAVSLIQKIVYSDKEGPKFRFLSQRQKILVVTLVVCLVLSSTMILVTLGYQMYRYTLAQTNTLRPLKFETWNVWTEQNSNGLSKEMGAGTEGFYYRVQRIIEYIKKSNADIINLQEWLNEEEAIKLLQTTFSDEYKIFITHEGISEEGELCALCTLVKKKLLTENDTLITFTYMEKDKEEVKVDNILGVYIHSLRLLLLNVHCRTLPEVRQYLAEHGVTNAIKNFSSKIKEKFGNEVQIRILMSGDFNAFNQGSYERDLYLRDLKKSLGKDSSIPSENAISTLTGTKATSTFFPSPSDYLNRDIYEPAKQLGLKVDILQKIILPGVITHKSSLTLTESDIKSIHILRELCQDNDSNLNLPEYLEDLFKNINLEALVKVIYLLSKNNEAISSIKILKDYLANNNAEKENIQTLFAWIRLLRGLWQTDNVITRGKNIDLIVISDDIEQLKSIVDSKGIGIPVEKYLKASRRREDYEENIERFTLIHRLFIENKRNKIEPLINISDHYPVHLIFQVKK